MDNKTLAFLNEVTDSLADDIEDFSCGELRQALRRAIEQRDEAARLGISEGLEMAAKWHDEQAKKRFADQESMKELAPVSSYQAFNDARKHQEHAAAIRALIEEQKL